MKKRKKIDGDEEEENEEDEDENEEEESDEEGEEDEEKEGSESESEEGGKKGKKKSKSKKKDKSKGKAKDKDKDKKLNKSVVVKNKKKLDTTKGKMKQNRSVILKKKNLLDKIKNKNKKPINQIKKPKRSQSVTTTKKPKNQKLMMRTNRSAIIKGKKNGLHKNTFTNNNTKYNRTTRSEQKFYKKRNKIDTSKKRSKTPIVSRFRNKFGNKLKKNKFSKTDINIRTIPNKKNKNYSTQRTFNTTSNDINKRRILTVGNDNLKRKYNFPSLRRESDELGPIIDKRHKFMQNTQNFFIPQRKLNLLRRDLIDSKYQEREEGFFNRITLYPKNTEQDENNSLKGDNLNPYSTNWPSSFLKIGYSSGFYYDDYQDGVPILRLKKIRNKIYLPPIQNSRYSQMSDKFGGNTSVNFNYMSRQERINYILNTENNNKDNVFKSQDARRRLLDKFNIKGFDLPTITNKKDEEENEESDEGEEEEDDEDEDKEEKEDDENEDQNSDEKNEEDEEESNSHPNEIE